MIAVQFYWDIGSILFFNHVSLTNQIYKKEIRQAKIYSATKQGKTVTKLSVTAANVLLLFTDCRLLLNIWADGNWWHIDMHSCESIINDVYPVISTFILTPFSKQILLGLELNLLSQLYTKEPVNKLTLHLCTSKLPWRSKEVISMGVP